MKQCHGPKGLKCGVRSSEVVADMAGTQIYPKIIIRYFKSTHIQALAGVISNDCFRKESPGFTASPPTAAQDGSGVLEPPASFTEGLFMLQ